MNSDSLTCANVYEDVVNNGYPIRCYSFPTTTILFPDCALYFVARAISGSTAPAMVLCTCALFVLQLLGCYLLVRLLSPADGRWAQTALLLGMGAVFLLVNAKSGLKNPFFRLPIILTYHGGSLISTIYGLALLLFLLKAPAWHFRHRLALAALFLNTVLGVASDRLLLMHMLAPVTVALLAIRVLAGGSTDGISSKRLALLVAVMLSGAMMGQRLLRLVQSPWQDAALHYPCSLEHAYHGLRLLVAKWQARLAKPDALHWLTILSFAGCSIHLAYHGARRLAQRRPLEWSPVERGLLLMSAYYVALTIGVTATVSYAGALYNPPHYSDFDWGAMARYFLPNLFLPFLLVGLWLVALGGKWSGPLRIAALIGIFGLAAVLFERSSSISRADDQAVWNYYPDYVAKFDAIAEEYNLDCGVASYWEAKVIGLLSRRKIRVHQVVYCPPSATRMTSFHWLSNSRCYFDVPRGESAPPRYQFILVNEVLPIPTPSRSEMIARFGEPAAVRSCGPYYLMIYNRPEDFAFHELAERESLINRGRYRCNLGETIRFEAASLPCSVLGPFPPEERTATEIIDPAGILSHGPGLLLSEAGTYRVSIVTSSPDDVCSGNWELALLNTKYGTSSVVAAGDIAPGWMRETVREVTISNRQRGRCLDCRVHFNGSGTLRMHHLEVTRIK